jgi:thiopeptide-type bacteriocin biosynthesis protein
VRRDAFSVTPADFFALRTPLLPFRILAEWPASPPSLPDALADTTSRSVLRERLRVIAGRRDVLEAIFLASPGFHSEVAKWLAADNKDDALEQALTRYVQRMASRPTPFGLFAGCSRGRFGLSNNLQLAGADQYRRRARVDNDFLYAFVSTLESDPRVRHSVGYRANSSLYKSGGRWRYVERSVNGTTRKDNLVEVDDNPALSAIIACSNQPVARSVLVDQILANAGDFDVNRSEAEQYVEQLIDNQALVSDLTPMVTGLEPLDDLLVQLRPWPSLGSEVHALDAIAISVAKVNESALGVDVQLYSEIESKLQAVGSTPDRSRWLQVDLSKPAPDARIAHSTIDDISSVVRTLHRVAPLPDGDPLKSFKDSFVARYDRREVPLFEALDEESGIGFSGWAAPTTDPAPLLQGIVFPEFGDPATLRWTGRDRFLLSKLESLQGSDASPLVLTDDDVDALDHQGRPGLPTALHVMAAIGKRSTNDDSVFAVIRSVAGPSGAKLLGRFCHADPELSDSVRAHLRDEEASTPAAIFAEIAHLPEGRLGNVVARPVLRTHEIVFLGRSGASTTSQIPVSDLLVSVRGDRIVLRSASRGVEVLPRMTNAHNYRKGLTVYRFLCSLQTQNVYPSLMWQWGPLEAFSFLPRVEFRNCVLARARWRAERRRCPELWRDTLPQRASALRVWRARTAAPRFCLLTDGDQELLVDFDNALSIETLLEEIATRPEFTLTEMCPAPDQLVAHGPEGSFVNEVVIPFTIRYTSAPTHLSSEVNRTAVCQRTFVPGSEWTYAKLYAGTASVDALLTRDLRPFLHQLNYLTRIERWFFVRYSDPEWHLRIRVKVPQDALSAYLIGLRDLSRTAIADGRLWRLQLDTYEREAERYGGEVGIELAEELFWHDSETSLKILSSLTDDSGLASRWLVCLLSWHLTLSDFGLTTEDKLSFVRERAATIGGLIGADRRLHRSLGDRYRVERVVIDQVLGPDGSTQPPHLVDEIRALRQRSEVTADVIRRITDMTASGHSDAPLTTLVGSYLHMNANRLLRSAHRRQEFVLFDFLGRHYESILARARGRGTRIVP